MARYPSDLCFDGDEHGGGRKGTGCIFLEERRLRACADLPSADCPLETFSRTLATASQIQAGCYMSDIESSVFLNFFLENTSYGQCLNDSLAFEEVSTRNARVKLTVHYHNLQSHNMPMTV